jgi:hypothetical protein
MRIGKLRDLQTIAVHSYVHFDAEVVGQFGEYGCWGDEQYAERFSGYSAALTSRLKKRKGEADPNYIGLGTVGAPPKECPHFYRMAFFALRDDGELFEDYMDFQVGEPLATRAQKGATIERRKAFFLLSEKCLITDRHIYRDDWCFRYKGKFSILAISAIWGMLTRKKENEERRVPPSAGSFEPGGTFNLGYDKSLSAIYDRKKILREEFKFDEVDSSLGDRNIMRMSSETIPEVQKRNREKMAKANSGELL